MLQSRLLSLLEAKANTLSGFVISVLVWRYLIPIIYPDLTTHATWGRATSMTLLFTCISIARNYVVRRFFNYQARKKVATFQQSRVDKA